jgi:hypothetical protein
VQRRMQITEQSNVRTFLPGFYIRAIILIHCAGRSTTFQIKILVLLFSLSCIVLIVKFCTPSTIWIWLLPLYAMINVFIYVYLYSIYKRPVFTCRIHVLERENNPWFNLFNWQLDTDLYSILTDFHPNIVFICSWNIQNIFMIISTMRCFHFYNIKYYFILILFILI